MFSQARSILPLALNLSLVTSQRIFRVFSPTVTVVINNQVHARISVRWPYTSGDVERLSNVYVTRLTKYQALIPSLCLAQLSRTSSMTGRVVVIGVKVWLAP
jgi:hypothetical protein